LNRRTIEHGLDSARAYFDAHMATILIGGLVLGLIALAFGILCIWLGSRGQMMLIRAVATGRADLGEHWGAVKYTAHSLFLFRIVFALVAFVVFAGIFGIGIAIVASAASTSEGLLITLIPLIIGGICVGIAFAIANSILRNFVAPIMYHFNVPCTAAWSQFFGLLRGNIGALVGFFLIRIVYFMVLGFLAILVGCLTCCLGFLPVIHQTILAPFYVFDRAFSLYVLQSLGPDYVMMAPPGYRTEESAPPPEPPLE